MAYDYRDPAIRAKAHAAASLLGEPAASELRAALDALGAADAEAKQASALRAALLEVYRVLSGEEPADDALAALAEYTVDEARHVKRLLAEARADLAEARLRLAIWSGEGAPDGWTAAADGVPSIERDIGDLTAEVYADGRWLIWRDLRDGLAPAAVVEDHPGPRETTEALRAAEAWLRLLAGVPRG